MTIIVLGTIGVASTFILAAGITLLAHAILAPLNILLFAGTSLYRKRR